MGKRYPRAVETRDRHIMSLHIIVVVLFLLCFMFWYGWQQAPKKLTVHIPPDLRQGSEQTPNEVPPPNVYTFASYIFQQLNFWEDDGATEYGNNIFKLQHYLTPAYKDYLESDFQRRTKRGETIERRRTVSELPAASYSPERVRILSDGSWIVYLDYETAEYINGQQVKRASVRWPLRVVRYDVNREKNPWGLALDGFAADEPPERLDISTAGIEEDA